MNVLSALDQMPGRGATCPMCGGNTAKHVLRGKDRMTGGPGAFLILECCSCALAFTEPRLTDDALKPYYPSSYHAPAEVITARGLDARIERLAMKRLVTGAYGRITERPPGRLLDVGCGGGHLAQTYATRGWSVAGVEPSNTAAAEAARRGISVHQGTLDTAPWSPASFDAILFTDSLEHIHAPQDALTQAAQLLRPCGLVGVTVPNFGGWQRRLFRSRWWHLDVPRHLQHFDRDTLQEALRRAGLEPIEVTTSSHLLGLPGSLQYVVLGRCFGRGIRSAQAVMALMDPLMRLLDRVGGGDRLHVISRRVTTA